MMNSQQLLEEKLSPLFYKVSFNAVFPKRNKQIIELLFGIYQALQEALLTTPTEYTGLQKTFWLNQISLFEESGVSQYPLLTDLAGLLEPHHRHKIAQALYEYIDGLILESFGIPIEEPLFLETVAYKKVGFMLEAFMVIKKIEPFQSINYWAQYCYAIQLLHDFGLYKSKVGFKAKSDPQDYAAFLCQFIDTAYHKIDRKKVDSFFMNVFFSYHHQMYDLLRSELDFLNKGTFYFGGIGHLRAGLYALIHY